MVRVKLGLLTLISIFVGCASVGAKPDSWISDNEPASNCTLSEAAARGLIVVFNTRVRAKELYGDPYLGWPLQHRKEILETLKKRSSAIVDIPDFALSKVGINPVDEEEVVGEYRKVASDAGAKYLLILHSSGAVTTRGNLFQLLYPTIIGFFIFPGNEGEARATSQALLYNVDEVQPCLNLEVGGTAEEILPYIFFDVRSLFIKARDRAYKEFLPLLNAAK